MQKETCQQNRLPLPVGISDFRGAVTQYYYIDKLLMIKDFLVECSIVSLFTCPRRFGKTLNMDMLKSFFERSSEDTSQDKQIWSCGEKYQSYQGRFPVVFVTFKDIHIQYIGRSICYAEKRDTSNRESGEGRFDIQLMPKKNTRPGVIIELKSEKNLAQDKLNELAQTALNQINENKYDTEMAVRGIATVFKYGAAFSGKKVAICVG